MKIEIGESLACSYLRHVKRCWLVQANWKASEHWDRHASDAELETLFHEMKERFDQQGGVFKQTKDAAQLLKQGEIDVVGVDQDGGVHAMEVAFHEAGLNYGNTAETGNRVLKKMLRTLMVLRAYLPRSTPLHIYFLSPKVNPVVQEPLEHTFEELLRTYTEVDWHLVSNDGFAEQVMRATLEKASAVADTSELFVRSAKLLELTDSQLQQGLRPRPTPRIEPIKQNQSTTSAGLLTTVVISAEIVEQVKAIRKRATESWVNIYKGARNLQGLPHEPFGTRNVESTAKSCVRKINRECGLTLEQIEGLAQAYCG